MQADFHHGLLGDRASQAQEKQRLSEITEAIVARQTQITQLQSDIEALQRVASVLGGKATATGQAKAKSKPKQKRRKRGTAAKATGQAKARAKLKATPQPKPKAPGKRRHKWSAAEKAAIGKRMKVYWAKRRKASQ